MSNSIGFPVFKAIAFAGLFTIVLRGGSSAAPDSPSAGAKVSSYAPAEDLSNQLRSIIARVDESLAKPDDFDDARQSRIAKEANVAAVIALGLGICDQDHASKRSASSILIAAQSLAKAADYSAARSAIDSLKLAAEGKPSQAAASPELRWQPVAPLGLLMKEVPIINSNLKRAVQPERFKAQTKASAGAAAVLAVVAQEAATDHDAVKHPADIAKWEQFCFEMRDAAGGVNRAIHAGDAEGTQQAFTRLSKTCEQCHRVFR
ncbi:MAG TPA: hypothetical protein VG056_09350 [Pirellulales bacterium]|nr:hypothetical protein [Pirellulales bacterium]